MLLALALVMTDTPQVRLDQLIVEWCAARSANTPAMCVSRQRDGLRKFQHAASILHDPERSLAAACLRKGAVAPSLNWTTAGDCLNEAVFDHIARFRSPEQDLRPTPLPDIRWVPLSPGIR